MTVVISNISKYYGADLILEGVSGVIAPGDRIGLVGRNGAGKTTLLRIIAGTEVCDTGTVELPRNFSIGYLDQEVSREYSGTIRNYLLPAFSDLLNLGQRLREMERQMAESQSLDPAVLESLMARYAQLANQFELEGGYEVEAKIKRTVQGLGIDYDLLDRPLSQLSGGERVRVGLARLLLSEPDLMLLDEPTNHLDMKAIEWLEGYLSESRSSIVMVSHDRYFLDRVVGVIWEIDNRRLAHYRGSYTAYQRQREERRERQMKIYEEQQAEIEKLENYIRRYMAGNRSTMAKSRLKRLERIERVDRPSEEKGLRISFSPSLSTGKVVFRARALTKGFDGSPLFSGLTFEINRHDRLGIVGPNGAGKTTLLNVLAGRTKPDAGEVVLGHQVKIGYYSQTLEDLNEDNTILEEALSVRNVSIGEMRSFLASFLFFGEEVFSPVKELSGGEKARLALAKLLLSDANTLLLDEPTNHLDIDARGALESALREFPGTIVMVSHDRYFLDRVATRIMLLEEGQAQFFSGNYTAFREAQAAKREDAAKESVVRKVRASNPAAKRSEGKSANRELDLSVLEKDIERLEREHRELGEKLCDPLLYQDAEQAQETVANHRETEERLAELYKQWEKLVEGLNSSG